MFNETKQQKTYLFINNINFFTTQKRKKKALRNL